MKKHILLLALLLSYFVSPSQNDKKMDSTAIFILDRMSTIIGDLTSVTFDLNTSIDNYDDSKNIVKHYLKSTVSFSGPDKLLTKTEGTKGKYGFWYDGEYLTYYNVDENNYVTLEAPDTTIEMIDEMHKNFDFKFPAADFFYPSFTDDLMDMFDEIKFLGTVNLSDETCYHIMAINKDMTVQFWISNKTYLLPKHFVITYKNEENMQYESSFENWSLNPNIPDAVFSFMAPPTAQLISILKQS